MVRPRRLPRNLALVLGLAASAVAASAVDESAWRFRQPVVIEAPGLVRLDLPDATLDAAQPDLRDLRLLDASGREVPFAVLADRPRPPARLTPTRFDVGLEGASTRIIVATGTSVPLDAVGVETPAAGFLKPAQVEISDDGHRWETLATGRPLFRQSGAENLDLALGGHSAEFLRITLDDSRSRPVPVTGVHLVGAADPGPPPLAVPVAVRREEFAGETLLTVDLGARNLPLTALELSTPEALFSRRVTVAVRELREGESAERVLAEGTIYRVPGEGGFPLEHRTVALHAAVPARELLVHVANGDSPPLADLAVRVRRRPVTLVVQAAAAGSHRLLVGQPQAMAPRYDLARLRDRLGDASAEVVTPGALEPNPDHRAPAVLPDVPLGGAPLDPSPWRWRKPATLAAGAFHELELDLEVLAHARADFGDLRLVRDGRQVPYLLERTALTRAVDLAPAAASDPQRPTVSRWEIPLPRARLPLRRLVLTSDTPLFQRQLRIFEKITDDRGRTYEHTHASIPWHRRPGEPGMLSVPLTDLLRTDRLYLETDNGDNPPLALTAAEAAVPVVRLLFRDDAAAPLFLHYGNDAASAPRYDLALVADRLVGAERHPVRLGAEEGSPASWASRAVAGLRSGPVFWGALILVVATLLFSVAKLLPKPPARPS